MFRRCSIDSISQRADWIFFWMYSRVAWIGLLVPELFLVIARDRQLRRVLVGQPDLVAALFVVLDDQVGNDVVGVFDLERRARAAG